MPQQELFFKRDVEGQNIRVVKSYDSHFAREVYDDMDKSAREQLFVSLEASEHETGAASDDDIWEEIAESAREDWNRFSFFVVQVGEPRNAKSLFVSADWPTAQTFAMSV